MHRIDIIEYKKKLLQTSTSIDRGNRWIPVEGICGSFFFDEYHLTSMQYSDFPAYRTKWGYRTNHVDENAVEPCKIWGYEDFTLP